MLGAPARVLGFDLQTTPSSKDSVGKSRRSKRRSSRYVLLRRRRRSRSVNSSRASAHLRKLAPLCKRSLHRQLVTVTPSLTRRTSGIPDSSSTRIADFCDEMANSPRSFFDDDAPLTSRTLDGKPLRNERFIAKCLEMFSWTGDDVFAVISAMFCGAAEGWRKFTSEFAPGGPIDQLTPYQCSVLFIPATNDHNEGILGALRIFLRRNPCSTTATINALERMQRNGTEGFITKVSTPPLETWVMREGRTIAVKRDAVTFGELVAADYRGKADAHVQKVAKKSREEKERLERLRAVGLVTEVDAIGRMTLPELREQLEIYIDIIKDPILDKKVFRWNMVKSAIPRRMAVIAALGRYQTANPGLLEAHNCPELLPSPMDIDGELVEGLSVGINLEDEDYMDEDEL
ncbi:hypothetical protein K525DRAFT_274157 [Schizophyllum commune Loenen D]|nr:hypothetical protein K525DRAFT_274157 [Schizophyllum commune Loenen D]